MKCGITKIEPIEIASRRYDITVKDYHNFFANGVLVHNCQNLPDWFERYKDVLWEVSIKLDGSSMTVYHNNGDTGVCSRNLDIREFEEKMDGPNTTRTNTFWKVARSYGILEAMTKAGLNIALQGELIGEGIQGNPEKIKGQDFYVFDIWDIDKGRHATTHERRDTLGKLQSLGCLIKEVPVIHDSAPVFHLWPTMADILRAAGEGGSLNAPIREGLVFKATSPIGGEIPSFKAINTDYLLKFDR